MLTNRALFPGTSLQFISCPEASKENTHLESHYGICSSEFKSPMSMCRPLAVLFSSLGQVLIDSLTSPGSQSLAKALPAVPPSFKPEIAPPTAPTRRPPYTGEI